MDDEKKTLTVDCGSAGERLDIFLAGSLNDVSRSQVQKLIGDERVLLNGERASKKALLRQGDVVEVSGLRYLSKECTLLPQDIPLIFCMRMTISPL